MESSTIARLSRRTFIAVPKSCSSAPHARAQRDASAALRRHPGRPHRLRRGRSRIAHVPRIARLIEVESLRLLSTERPRAAAPEYRDLPARLVDRAIPVQSLRKAQRRFAGGVAGDQLRFRLGAEAGKTGLRVRRGELQYLEAAGTV